MAKMLFDPPNFLVLDEPTNHLDMATKEMLITALSEFEGTMLFVSHDRHFLAALSNRVLELTPEGIHTIRRRLHRICRAHRPGGAGPAQLAHDPVGVGRHYLLNATLRNASTSGFSSLPFMPQRMP